MCPSGKKTLSLEIEVAWIGHLLKPPAFKQNF